MPKSIEFDAQVWIQESEFSELWSESTTISGLGDFFIEDIIVETSDQPEISIHRDLSQEYESISVMIPELEYSLSEMQSYLTYMCLCIGHDGFDSSFGFETFGGEMFMGGFGGEHGDHDHCKVADCGGHFDKNGFCEKCGSRRKFKI